VLAEQLGERNFMKISELPFHERPAIELLALDRDADPDYAGYGWARIGPLYLSAGRRPRRLDDALVIAVHASDDGPALADDVELTFELPDGAPSGAKDGAKVRVHASVFLERWLPELPRAPAIALAMCNPRRATLRRIAAAAAPVHYGIGDVRAWQDPARGARIRLQADEWRTLLP
jgi:hypothetical protein